MKPVVAPIVIAVPAFAKFNVVTVAVKRLNVAAELVISPPLTAKSPVIVSLPLMKLLPPTRRSKPTAAPPNTCRAPVAVEDALVVFVTVVTPLIRVAPETSNLNAGSIPTPRPTEDNLAISIAFTPSAIGVL